MGLDDDTLPTAEGEAFDDTTPTDSPSAAVSRLTRDQRELCEVFDRLAPLLDSSPRTDRPFLYEQFILLLSQIERGARECREALTAQLEIESVFQGTK